jgi:ribonucleoside-triphosphate reductase
VVGYLRPVKQWNDGKQAEYSQRRTFKIPNAGDGVTAAVVLEKNLSSSPPKKKPEELSDAVVGDQSFKLLGSV